MTGSLPASWDYRISLGNSQRPTLQRDEPVLDIALIEDLHFDQATQTGSVFHMLSAMPTHGYVGVTSVADSAAEAQASYDAVVSILTEEAAAVSR